ncbi:MAG: glycosyltransferase family 39 protein [Candidatus Dormibacteria bacterium]
MSSHAAPDGGQQARRRGRLAIPWPGLTIPLLVLALLKLPSLFEPHWYTDEAGYANTAWQMAHGKVLYLTVWNNKPPLLFWIYQLAQGGFGNSELGLHLLSGVAGLAALAAVFVLARWSLSPRRTWIVMLLGAGLLGTPLLNGDLALPECFLVAFTAWAMVCVVAARRAQSQPRALLLAGLAGLLLAAGCLVQQTALADAFAAVLVLLVGRRGWATSAALVSVLVVAIAAVLAPFVAAAGAHRVFFFLVTSYAGYTTGSLHPSLASVLPRALALGLLVGGAWAARSWSPQRLVPWVWLGTMLLAYIIPNRPYVHFLLPAVPAAVLLVGRLDVGRLLRRPTLRTLGALSLGASTAITGVLWAGLLASGFSGGSLFTIKLTGEYYPAFVGHLTKTLPEATYVSLYDQRAVAEHAAAVWVAKNGLRGSTGVVWSADSWDYLLADLRPVLPVPPIYMDQLWLGTDTMLNRIRTTKPVVVILTSDAYNQFGPIEPLLRQGYTEVQALDQGQLWVRTDVAARILRTARRAAR